MSRPYEKQRHKQTLEYCQTKDDGSFQCRPNAVPMQPHPLLELHWGGAVPLLVRLGRLLPAKLAAADAAADTIDLVPQEGLDAAVGAAEEPEEGVEEVEPDDGALGGGAGALVAVVVGALKEAAAVAAKLVVFVFF